MSRCVAVSKRHPSPLGWPSSIVANSELLWGIGFCLPCFQKNVVRSGDSRMNELTNFICPLSETPFPLFSFKRLTDRAQRVICLIFLQSFVLATVWLRASPVEF